MAYDVFLVQALKILKGVKGISACTRPEVWEEGKSICVMSPVTII